MSDFSRTLGRTASLLVGGVGPSPTRRRRSSEGLPRAKCADASGGARRARRARPHPGDRDDARHRAGAAHAVPDPARPRRPRARARPGDARVRAPARARLLRRAAAAPLRRRLLHLAPRPAHERAPDHRARGRTRGCDDGRRGRRRPCVRRRALVGERVRARRDRLADRPPRRDLDRAPPRRPAQARDDRRGREPRQRRDRARRVPRRGRGRDLRVVLGVRNGWVVRRQRRRRRRRRPGRRLARAAAPASPRQPAGGDHDLAPHRATSRSSPPSSSASRPSSPP